MKSVQTSPQNALGEARMFEQMHVVDAVYEAIEAYGRTEFARHVVEHTEKVSEQI